MWILKTIVRSVSTLALHVALFGLVLAIIFSRFIGDTKTIKTAIDDSKIYDSLVQSIIDDNVDNFSQSSTSIPLDDPEIQKIILQSFDSNTLKDNTEATIDSVQNWLNGKSDKLEFSFDLSEGKAKLADNLSDYAVNRLDRLPACSTFSSETNVFRIGCLPPDVDLRSLRETLKNDFNNTPNFLSDPVITEDNLPKSADGQRIDQKFSFARSIYQILDNGILIFGLGLVLASLFFIIVRLPLRRGFKALGRDLSTNGLMLLLFTVAYAYVLPRFTSSFSLNISGNPSTQLFNRAADNLMHKLDILIINTAIQIALVGIVILIIERLTRSSDIYAKVYEKSGLEVSDPPKHTTSKTVKKHKPNEAPVQTSEVPRHTTNTVQKKKKYRKIQL